jgi:ABC-type Fe3+ transport system permease subunit
MWLRSDHLCQIFLAGLVLQLASLIFFCAIYARFLYKVHAEEQVMWMRDSKQHWISDWRTLAAAMAVSCISILVCLLYSNLVTLTNTFADSFVLPCCGDRSGFSRQSQHKRGSLLPG